MRSVSRDLERLEHFSRAIFCLLAMSGLEKYSGNILSLGEGSPLQHLARQYSASS